MVCLRRETVVPGGFSGAGVPIAAMPLLAHQSRLASPGGGDGAGPPGWVGQADGPAEQLGAIRQIDHLATAPGQRAEQGGGPLGAEAAERLIGGDGVVAAEVVAAHP